ncbi:MAG: hypothetical protein IJT02_08370 [Synergistaceae bacterium]|nr:hypothetical protein [Synergistaceae bacterium]
MEKGTFTVTLADGTQLSGLGLNGNNFVSKKEVTADTFRGKLSKVIIEGDAEADEAGLIGTHHNMELVQIAHYTQATHGCEDGYYFVLREIPAAELEALRNRGDIDYIAMMTGVEL